MYRLPKLGLVLTFIALLILAAPALATDYQYSSTDEQVDAATGATTGTETGDLGLGAYTGSTSATIDPITGAITNGMQTITFGDGSTLTSTFEGQIFADGSVMGTFAFIGGTGALAGASGGGTFVGVTDGSTFDSDIEGTLTLP